MTALQNALSRADQGLDWSYPCLIWIADYLLDATGRDPAAKWRCIEWSEATAKHELAWLAGSDGGANPGTAVERALDVIANRDGWREADCPMQGAVMIGVYTSSDGIGVPAIFDGQDRWIISNDGKGWTSVATRPERMWEVQA